MMKKFILVEGIPGSGKSTCARFLANQFERNGYKCSLFLETTYEHPIIQMESIDDNDAFIDSYLNKWSNFIAKSNDNIIVMESAFFQSPIIHLLHKDADREVIKSLIIKASEILCNEECSLVYFYQKDAKKAVQTMINIRGKEEFLIRKHNEYKHEAYFVNRKEQGVDSHITFFLDYVALANEIVNKVKINTLIIENSEKDYELYEQQLLNSFRLNHIPDPIVDLGILDTYKRTYHNKNMNFSVTIELIDGCLTIFGNKKLKPKSDSEFYLNDMSVVTSFIMENGKVIRLIIHEKDLYANKSDDGTAFERIS